MKRIGLLSAGAAAGFVIGALAMNLNCMTSANAAAAAAPASKGEIEAVVRDYIATHGEDLMASIQNAATRAQVDKVAKLVTADTPTSGPANAPVTIVEFSDFQCPFCDRVQPELAQVREKYGDKVRWVYKNLPLEFHPEARPAAYAAMAANKQGKFWEYSKQLWSQQAQLGEKTYVAVAEGLKLDMKKFNADRASDAVKAQVDADQADSEAVGARGTPFFMVNGQGMSGAVPAAQFMKMIDAELKTAAEKK